MIDRLYEMGVRLIALRSAGYNNVDVKAAFGKIHVVHVPAYSPYAVAEHAMALLFTYPERDGAGRALRGASATHIAHGNGGIS